MAGKPDYLRKKFRPMLDKSLPQALAHRIGKEFPRMGGERIRHLCAEMVLEVVSSHLRRAEHVGHGQILWLAVDVDDPPGKGKTMAETDLVPVVLDLHADKDVHSRLGRVGSSALLEQKAIRLCHQAYEQGGLLSNCDLAELLTTTDARICKLMTDYQKRTGQVIPRRATIHDVGSGLTHKSIICRKRFIDGLSPDEIARDTHHSLEAVDRYLGQYDRVLHCHNLGMPAHQIAFALDCSFGLVAEYLAIINEISGCHAKKEASNK